MARNEEKQQGRLNRLWLQREREEGRLKDKPLVRPKLSTLNSASSVKKWIPCIKREIEYCLQQSQLAHYPERKIAEFQLQIEDLEKEYKRFIRKLHQLDPACKDHPWTPRAYRKRRADVQDSQSFGKIHKVDETPSGFISNHLKSEFEPDLTGQGTTRNKEEVHCPSHTSLDPPKSDLEDQDQPLCFDRARLAFATAAFRGPSDQQSLSESQKLTRVLQLSLPNLSNSSSKQTCESTKHREDNVARTVETGLTEGENNMKECNILLPPAERTVEKTCNVLGLDCYSSSEESDD